MNIQSGVDYEVEMQGAYDQCLAAYDDGEPVSTNPYIWHTGSFVGWAKAQIVIAESERFKEIKRYRSM
jgi:hypothetical protein